MNEIFRPSKCPLIGTKWFSIAYSKPNAIIYRFIFEKENFLKNSKSKV
jgi:hypothetical protein